MDTSDDFILVTKNHKRCAKRSNKNLSRKFANSTDYGFIDFLPDKKLNTKISDIFQAESFMTTFMTFVDNTLKGQPNVDIICYGLGNFFNCYQSQYQLALLMIIIRKLKVLKLLCNVEFFDPQFTEIEKRWLEENDYNVTTKNELGLRHVDRFTIFYMPHCGRGLYNNVLYANWSCDQLKTFV